MVTPPLPSCYFRLLGYDRDDVAHKVKKMPSPTCVEKLVALKVANMLTLLLALQFIQRAQGEPEIIRYEAAPMKVSLTTPR